MALDMVLNDLSLTPATDVYTARSRISGLVQTIKHANLHNIKGALRTQADLHDIMLADSYPFHLWATDRSVNPDERLFLLKLATKATSPLFSTTPSDSVKIVAQSRMPSWFRRGEASVARSWSSESTAN